MKLVITSLMCLSLFFMPVASEQANAYEITLSLYTQGLDLNALYNNGDFKPDDAIIESAPTSLLVIVGNPANVEDILKVPEIGDPFKLAEGGSDFHFEVFQPFRFQDRFNGLFSSTVDDPVLFVPDNGVVLGFQDDGVLADDRIDLTAFSAELPESYYEVDFGDTIFMKTHDGIKLAISKFTRLSSFEFKLDVAPVPEPGTIVLLGLGFIGILGIFRGRKMKQRHFSSAAKMSILIACLMSLSLVSSVPRDAHAGLFDGWRNMVKSILMQSTYAAYSSKLGTCVKEDGPAGEFLSCDNGSVEWNNGQAIAVYGPFYDKWKSLNWGWGPLGQPVGNVVGTWGSPQGTGGQVQFFEGGDIYLHGNGTHAGQAFFVTGAIKAVFDRDYDFGTGGWLGFPISDEYTDPSNNYQRSDFEGGCITTDDGNRYFEVKGCKPGLPPASPKLVGATASCVKSGKELSEQTGQFKLYWDIYTPSNYTLTFDPNTLTTSESFEMFRGVGVIANGGENGGVLSDIPAVNEGYKLGLKFSYNYKGLKIKASDGNNSININPTDLGSASLKIGSWDISKIGSIKKFVDNFKEIAGIFDDISKGIDVFKRLPKAGCSVQFMGRTNEWETWDMFRWQNADHDFNFADPPKKPIWSVDLGYNYSNLCCSSEPYIKESNELFGAFKLNPLKVACETRDFPVAYGFNLGGTGDLSLSAEIKANGKTSCEAFKVCATPKVNAKASLGLFISYIHKKIARADAKGIVDMDIGWKNFCFIPKLEAGKFELCTQLKAQFSVTAFSFLKYETKEMKIGRPYGTCHN